MLQYPIRTLLTLYFKAVPHTEQATDAQRREYQYKTGSILYTAIVSRPDISYAFSLLCQFNANPSSEHLHEADRVLRYLAYTREYAIEYSLRDGDKSSFIAVSDASFADDPATRRSTQGYLFKLFNGSILQQSIQQQTVITLTIKAKLLALLAMAKETITILGLIIKEHLELTTKLRHINIHHFWLRQVY